MLPRRPWLFRLALLAVLAGSASAQRSDLLPPARRAATVDAAARILASRTPAPVPAGIRNPFAPEGFDGPDAAEGTEGARPGAPLAPGARPAAVSPRELLTAIAANLQPTGTLARRGEPVLLFGNRQVRVGEELAVTYEGTPYLLTVTAIQSTSFTVRLNQEEITRPIRPGAKP